MTHASGAVNMHPLIFSKKKNDYEEIRNLEKNDLQFQKKFFVSAKKKNDYEEIRNLEKNDLQFQIYFRLHFLNQPLGVKTSRLAQCQLSTCGPLGVKKKRQKLFNQNCTNIIN